MSTDKQPGGRTQSATECYIWPLLVAFLVLLAPLITTAQFGPNAIRSDNSDWWSMLRGNDDSDSGLTYRPGTSERSPLNFEVVGLTLGSEDLFKRAESKVGPTAEIDRGDAATARAQLCYSSPDRAQYFIFERGEVNDSFYLFASGANWTGQERCAESALISPQLHTASGLGLGESPAEIEKILGIPTSSIKGRFVYDDIVQKRTSDEDLARFRKQNPEKSDKEFHENYDFYTLSTDIEVRFEGSRSVYVGVSQSEVY